MIKYISIPNSIMNKKDELFYELFKYNDINEFKLFLYLIAKSTMIAKTNAKLTNKSITTAHSFELDSDLFSSSYINRKSMNYTKIENFVNKINSQFFKNINCDKKTISFQLSNRYAKELNSERSYIFELEDLKNIGRNIRALKLKLIIGLNKKSGFLHLNFLLKALDLGTVKTKYHKIEKIRELFEILKIKYEYIHPSNQYSSNENDFKFFYEIEDKKEVVENKEMTDEIIDDIFSTDDIDELLKENNKSWLFQLLFLST